MMLWILLSQVRTERNEVKVDHGYFPVSQTHFLNFEAYLASFTRSLSLTGTAYWEAMGVVCGTPSINRRL